MRSISFVRRRRQLQRRRRRRRRRAKYRYGGECECARGVWNGRVYRDAIDATDWCCGTTGNVVSGRFFPVRRFIPRSCSTTASVTDSAAVVNVGRNGAAWRVHSSPPPVPLPLRTSDAAPPPPPHRLRRVRRPRRRDRCPNNDKGSETGYCATHTCYGVPGAAVFARFEGQKKINNRALTATGVHPADCSPYNNLYGFVFGEKPSRARHRYDLKFHLFCTDHIVRGHVRRTLITRVLKPSDTMNVLKQTVKGN